MSFITPLADVHVYEKDEAKFELEISREPRSFRWLKGSQELSNDEKFELQQKGKRHVLLLKSAQYEDEAKYMFEAEDKRTSGRLIIKGTRTEATTLVLSAPSPVGSEFVQSCQQCQVLVNDQNLSYVLLVQ